MRTTLIVAAGITSLLLVAALNHGGGSGAYRLPAPKPAQAEVIEAPKTTGVRQAKFEVLASPATPESSQTILLAAIEAETDPDRRSEALTHVVESVSDADLRKVLDSLANDGSPAAAELRPLLVRRWAETDAPGAASWVAQLPENPARRVALEQVAIAWANHDFSGATEWVGALPEGENKQAATINVAYEVARTTPIEALDLASTLGPTPERDNLLVHAVSQWSATDSTNAAAWAMKVEDPDLRDRLVAAVAIAAAKQDGSAGAVLAASGLASGEEQDRASVSIVQRWAQHSPEAAAAWVSQFPATPSRDAAVQNLLEIWVGRDAAAAESWVHELPPGPLRESGMAAYSQALADRVSASSLPVGTKASEPTG